MMLRFWAHMIEYVCLFFNCTDDGVVKLLVTAPRKQFCSNGFVLAMKLGPFTSTQMSSLAWTGWSKYPKHKKSYCRHIERNIEKHILRSVATSGNLEVKLKTELQTELQIELQMTAEAS